MAQAVPINENIPANIQHKETEGFHIITADSSTGYAAVKLKIRTGMC